MERWDGERGEKRSFLAAEPGRIKGALREKGKKHL